MRPLSSSFYDICLASAGKLFRIVTILLPEDATIWQFSGDEGSTGAVAEWSKARVC
tara:strand:+ start:370 stop:537 length:168 start_codon:yes stop_codon:yes gene_type:complete